MKMIQKTSCPHSPNFSCLSRQSSLCGSLISTSFQIDSSLSLFYLFSYEHILMKCYDFLHLDEQDAIQKKTFTKWVNIYLSMHEPPYFVDDLFEDLKDGTKLLALLEVLSGQKLVRNEIELFLRSHRSSSTVRRVDSNGTDKQSLLLIRTRFHRMRKRLDHSSLSLIV